MANLVGDSHAANTPAIAGNNNAGQGGSVVPLPGVNPEDRFGVGVEGTGAGGGVVGKCSTVNAVGNGPNLFVPIGGDAPGVLGESEKGPGVRGHGGTDGVVGEGTNNGVVGRTNANAHSGVWADHTGGGHGISATSDAAGGVGVYGRGSLLAGYFEGNVKVNGNIEVTGDVTFPDADLAEEFAIAESEVVSPGTVMVICDDGSLSPSERAYDKRVAGIVSGAGIYKPAIVLDANKSNTRRTKLALVGKVYCKVDAQFGEIQVGDLLTTSPTPGHAMKASNPFESFGAVIGKALKPLHEGRGMVPVLVSLQ